MTPTLYDQLKNLDYDNLATPEVKEAFLKRIEEGQLTRDEGSLTHFNVYFLPFNPQTKQVFLVHHKKANSWIAPGGHTDLGENLDQAVRREVSEELGVTADETIEGPFLLTYKDIENQTRCKRHYDSWFLLKTDGSDFKIDPVEFYDTKWLTLDEAEAMVENEDQHQAFKKLRAMISADQNG